MPTGATLWTVYRTRSDALSKMLMRSKINNQSMRPLVGLDGLADMLIGPEHLKIEHWPPRQNKGGQHVGTGPSGVKITHIPSGIEACVDIGRSQHVNRLIAMEMIEAALTHPRFR